MISLTHLLTHSHTTGSDDTLIKLFDTHTGDTITTLNTLHTDNIFYAKDVPHSRASKLLSCGADGRVVLTYVDTVSHHCSTTLHVHRGRAHRLALIPSTPHEFYSCGEDGCLLTHDLRDSHTTPRIVTHFRDAQRMRCSIYVLGVHPTRHYEVALGGAHEAVKIYDTRRMRAEGDGVSECVSELCPPLLRDRLDEVTVTGLQYNYSGDHLVLSYNDEDVYTMDPLLHYSSSGVESSSNSLTCCDGDDDDNEDQSGVLGQECDECDGSKDDDNSRSSSEKSTRNKGYVMKFSGHRNCDTVKQITYMGSRSEWIVSGSDCGHVFIWSSSSGKLVKMLQADDTGAVNCLAPHPYLPLLATSGLDDTAKLWAPCGSESSLVSFFGERRRASSVQGSGSESDSDELDSDSDSDSGRERERVGRCSDSGEDTKVNDHPDEVNNDYSSDCGNSDDREYVSAVCRSNVSRRQRYEEEMNSPSSSRRSMTLQMYMRLYQRQIEGMLSDDSDDNDDSNNIDDSEGSDESDGSYESDDDSNEYITDDDSDDGNLDSSNDENNSSVDGVEGSQYALTELAETERLALIARVRDVAVSLLQRPIAEERDLRDNEDVNDDDICPDNASQNDVEDVGMKRKFYEK